ncbi:MAG: hypothetical protein ACOYK8_01785 [Alphaproteobacteria bacterium]
MLQQDGNLEKEIYLGVLLNAPMARGITTAEVHGFLDAATGMDEFFLNKSLRPKLPENSVLIGAVGSGKKGIKTINISTLAGLVVASYGAYFAKPVSHSTSSLTGSSDILEMCGAKLKMPQHNMVEILQQTRFAAFSIENQIPRFDAAYGGKFLAPHALSLAFPALLSPIKLDHLIFGLSVPYVDISSQVLLERGLKNFTVVCSSPDNTHFMDEFCHLSKNSWVSIKEGQRGKLRTQQTLKRYATKKDTLKNLSQGQSLAEQKEIFLQVASGKLPGPYQDMICVNAAFMMAESGIVKNLDVGIEIAETLIKQGAPRDVLNDFVKATQEA